MKKAIEMLGREKQRLQEDIKKIDLDLIAREEGIKKARANREELVDLLDSIDQTLNKLASK